MTDFKPCNEMSFDNPVIVDLPNYRIENAGLVVRIFSKTPIHKKVFRGEYTQFAIKTIGTIETIGEDFISYNNFTEAGSLCSSHHAVFKDNDTDSQPLFSEGLRIDARLATGCLVEFVVQNFNRTAILNSPGNVPVPIDNDSVKLNFKFSNCTFDNNTYIMRTDVYFEIITQVIPNIGKTTIGPLIPNNEFTIVKFTNLTVENITVSFGLQDWFLSDGVIIGANAITKEIQYDVGKLGRVYSVFSPLFQNELIWDPSYSIFFTGDESLVPSEPSPSINNGLFEPPESSNASVNPVAVGVGVGATLFVVVAFALAVVFVKPLREKLLPFRDIERKSKG